MTDKSAHPFSELSEHEVEASAVRLLSRAFCERHSFVLLNALSADENAPLTIGLTRPDDSALLRRVGDLLQRPLLAVQLNDYEINRALDIGWGTPERDPSRHRIEIRASAKRASVPKIIDQLLANAIHRGASDIHIESYREDIDVRLRIDGILHQTYTDLSPRNVDQAINRIKVLARLDVTEHRTPQDGRISCCLVEAKKERNIDMRISVIPSPWGEDVVIRLLGNDAGLKSLAQLGLSADHVTTLSDLLANPEGLILVTGPTGSGKTTSLYSALAHVSDGRRKVLTAEDPIEFIVPKINQKQISEMMTMHELLRAMLRHDPDVILVGEIRDLETGSTAIHAAATGHVVFGTLHTADSVGAVSRLHGMGLDYTDIADALLAVLAQRLVRRVCPECSTAVKASAEQIALFGSLLDGLNPQAGSGCEICFHTGYRGRVGVYELLIVEPEMQELIASGAPAVKLREHALEKGLVPLVTDTLQKVKNGLTTLDELVRVLPYRAIVAARERR